MTITLCSCSLSHKLERDARNYQKELSEYYLDPETSPVDSADLVDFQGLEFFDYDPDFNVLASWQLTPDAKPFKMATSTERRPIYRPFGRVNFEIDGAQYSLVAYKNLDPMSAGDEEGKVLLFVPFWDLTNGVESYGGGRYMDISYNGEKEIQLDFNQCYNPLCAYNENYSCPIPPAQNRLDLEIRAGVKKPSGH